MYKLRKMDGCARYQVLDPRGRIYLSNLSYDSALAAVRELNGVLGGEDEPPQDRLSLS